MREKIKQWAAVVVLLMFIALGGSGSTAMAAESISTEPSSTEGDDRTTPSTNTAEQETPSNQEESQKKKDDSVEIEKVAWSSEVKGLRVNQNATISAKEFLQLAPFAQLAIDKIDWGAGVPSTNTVGDFQTTLLVTLKSGKQMLFENVPYLVYSCEEETLISGLSYDKQAKKLTGKTDPNVQITAEAQFSKDPADVDITATESDEKGIFTFSYEKEPVVIALTVTKDPHVQYATTKYEVETNEVETDYPSQTGDSKNGTAQSTTKETAASTTVQKKKSEYLPQTGEKESNRWMLSGFYLCVALGLFVFRKNWLQSKS